MSSAQLNHSWVKEKAKEVIKDIIEINQKECSKHSSLWDIMKALQRRKFIALKTYIKNLEKSNTSNLTAHLTAVEQKKSKLTQEK